MRLLLDEMYPHAVAVAVALRRRGHDVVSIQRDRPGLRHRDDAAVFAAAQVEQRTLVTENAVDLIPIASAVDRHSGPHWGLVLTTNRQFPRHRPDAAVRLLVGSLDRFVKDHAETDAPSSMIDWLQPRG